MTECEKALILWAVNEADYIQNNLGWSAWLLTYAMRVGESHTLYVIVRLRAGNHEGVLFCFCADEWITLAADRIGLRDLIRVEIAQQLHDAPSDCLFVEHLKRAMKLYEGA